MLSRPAEFLCGSDLRISVISPKFVDERKIELLICSGIKDSKVLFVIGILSAKLIHIPLKKLLKDSAISMSFVVDIPFEVNVIECL